LANGLRIFDLSNANQPVPGNFLNVVSYDDVAVAGDYIFFITNSYGYSYESIAGLDLGAQAPPGGTVIGNNATYVPGTSVASFAVSETFMFHDEAAAEVRRVDLTDAQDGPLGRGTVVSDRGSIVGLINGRWLAIEEGCGIGLYDALQPTPVQLACYDVSGEVATPDMDAQYLYFPVRTGGLQVYRAPRKLLP
jgi:hypothetical protein